jgi:hypothetical protein
MKAKKISGFFSAGFCIAVFLIAALLGNGAADQSYFSPNYGKAPQTAQEREGLFKAIQNTYEKNISQVTQSGVDPYKALQNPYAFTDPQAALEQANTYRSIQKLNKIYQNSNSQDNWYYWSNMWLNEPQDSTKTIQAIKGPGNSLGVADAYSAMDNPYAFIDPQAALEQVNTYRSIQKLNNIYQNPNSADNWYYWSNMWLNGPQT